LGEFGQQFQDREGNQDRSARAVLIPHWRQIWDRCNGCVTAL
jgi:hypothetical protein